jgi:hypothetical protein
MRMRYPNFMAGGCLAVWMLGGAALAGTPAGLQLAGEYQVPAIEAEVGGIYPHPSSDDLYFLGANKNPAYTLKQQAKLAAEYRGKLLTVNRHTGQVVKAEDVGVQTFGGIASDGARLFISSVQPPEIVVWSMARGAVERRIPLDAPAGGLEYDAKRNRLLAQIYLKVPHLAVIDVKTGATVASLWSDESAMDLKLVGGDLLCTWVSSFDGNAFSELRRIHPDTGKVTGRVRLDGIHSSMAPLDRKLAKTDGFISLVTTNKESGEVKIQRFAYDRKSVSWTL